MGKYPKNMAHIVKLMGLSFFDYLLYVNFLWKVSDLY